MNKSSESMNKLEDFTLIKNIQKEEFQEESLREIISRHSGIYLEIVNQYCHDNNSQLKKDLVRDKDYNIYQSAIKFDESRNTKFSTYLGNEARWICLNTYNKQRKRPTVEYDEVILEKNPESQDYIQELIDSELLSKIFTIISKNSDSRVYKIFSMRYVTGKKNKVMPWKYISKRLNMSIQGCINIHNATIEKIKDLIKKELL